MPPKKKSRRDDSDSPVALRNGPAAIEACGTDAGFGALQLSSASQREDGHLERYITINVGGTPFTTSFSTLKSEASLLSQFAFSSFAGFPRDADGNVFINRDAKTFAHILNYLRGYGIGGVDHEDIPLLAEDATYFQLDGLIREIGLATPDKWRFAPGPGVSADRTEFCSSTVVSLIGSKPLAAGSHCVFFRVEKCDIVGIGVVPFEDPPGQQNVPFTTQKNSACYLCTGEVSCNFGSDPLRPAIENVPRYRENTRIGMEICILDAESPERISGSYWATLRFFKSFDVVHQESLPFPEIPLRFAAFIEGVSVLLIESP